MQPATKAKSVPKDHFADAFRRLEGDLDDLRRMAGLGMLAVEANEDVDDLVRFTVAEMYTKAAALWQQYQAAFPGNADHLAAVEGVP